MSTALRERPARAAAGNGGAPARRAVIRWAWRMFRREWRQQLLVLALVVVAVAATVIGAAVAVNTPPAANAGFGTAQDAATFQGPSPHLAASIASLQRRFGRVDVIENQTVAIPGSINTYDLRGQNSRGPFGQPMLALTAGRYPAAPGQVAVTPGVAAAFGLKVGSTWHQVGRTWRVAGLAQNPQNLLDEFALVLPGQVRAPTQVTVLFDAPGVPPDKIGPNVQAASSAVPGNAFNPETIVLALVTLAMLLIALVSVGGFTVLAQRRLRAIGMLGALGATDRHIRLVVRANGVVTGVAGALIGAALGLAGWLAYRPNAQASAHHLIGTFQLPWAVIAAAMVLAVVATFFAASRPARAITRVPVVTALAGRPAPPRQIRRSALPGVVLIVIAALLFAYTGTRNGGGAPELVLGFVALIAAVVLLAPFGLSVLARLGRRAPVAVRLALRDLARYRARSGSALAAISLGVLIAVLVCVLSAARYGNVLDYTGPNLAANQLIVYTPTGGNGPGIGGKGGPGGNGGPAAGGTLQSMAAQARGIAAALGSRDIVTLDSPNASLQHAAAGRQWGGAIYVATPQLLQSFGIKASQVNPAADVLSGRPGLSGITKMQLIYGNYGGGGPPGGNSYPCPATSCLANPVIQEVSALPSGTSAPNTLITQHAIRQLGLQVSVAGWLIQTAHPLTPAQVHNARLTASAAGLNIETKSSLPSLAEILNVATAFGTLLALAILAMSIGLIRSETASDLRTLAATGASSSTRRILTAATAGALALLGAVLGTVAAYIAAIAYTSNNSLDGLSGLSSIPVANLLVIVIGMPLAAVIAGWLLAGREPPAMARQPIE